MLSTYIYTLFITNNVREIYMVRCELTPVEVDLHAEESHAPTWVDDLLLVDAKKFSDLRREMRDAITSAHNAKEVSQRKNHFGSKCN